EVDAPEGPWWQRLGDRLMELPERPDEMRLMFQAGVYAAFLVWGIQLIADNWHTAEIMYSFMHRANLLIHEAGHVFFRPFGTWMMFLGGSLFQCLLPALIGIAFIWKQRDPFGALMCLWWTGENFLDVTPYIADARLMALPLVGEWNDDAFEARALRHDWHNILGMIGKLDSDQTLAATVHTLGALLMILSWIWGAMWLWKAWQQARVQVTV
ncbi:MAG: zinc ribbon domain-containing protein, partial [bacterium]